MKEAYQDYCSDESERSTLSFEDWCKQQRLESPQFQFWNLVLVMELTIFKLYLQALSELIPYFFANNKVDYALWLPIHLRDMLCL